MHRLRLPAVAGVVASLFAALAVLAPFTLPDASAPAIGTYYGYGLLGGWSVLVVSLVAVVVFASGSQRRADPDVAAGAALVLSLSALALAVLWALAVPYEVVVQITPWDWFAYHRWALVGVTAAMVLVALWYTYVLDLF